MSSSINLYDIIQRPILSEKAFKRVKELEYTFRVVKSASKDDIRLAIENAFKGVKVQEARTANFMGKEKRHGRKVVMTPAWKKAYVQLTKDSKPIEFFEGLQ